MSVDCGAKLIQPLTSTGTHAAPRAACAWRAPVPAQYTVRYDEGDASRAPAEYCELQCSAEERCSVSGLSPASSYRFEVTAINAVGEGVSGGWRRQIGSSGPPVWLHIYV